MIIHQPHISHWDQNRQGALNEAGMRMKLQELGYRVTRYIYPPGTLFPPHTHSVDKIDAVLAGQFCLEINGERLVLTAGDYIAVPRNVLHSAEVIGDEPVISLDAVKI